MNPINSKAEKKEFYKAIIALIIPMALQNLINVGVQAADVIMLGRLGEVEVSAASLAGQVNFIMTLFFFGLTSGAAVLTAQYWGKRDTVTIEKILGICLRIAIITAVLFTTASLFFPEQIMHIFSSEDAVIKSGAEYLKIAAWSFLPMPITMVYLNIVRSIEKVVISTVVYLISLVSNVILNAVFIFGLLGAPEMGVRGAALATTFARWIELIIVIIYALKINHVIKIRPKYLIKTNKVLFSDLVYNALPVTANELLWGGGMSAINAILGHLGSAAVAANSITSIVRQLAMVITFGSANAAAVWLGKTIGAGKIDDAKIYSVRFVKITIGLGIFGAILIVVITPLIQSFMNLSSESNEYLTVMLRIMAYFVIAASLNATFIVGIFRAGGDTKIGLVLDCGGMWLAAIVPGFLAAFVFKLPVPVVYAFLTCDELVKLPFSIKRYRSYKWLRNLTRDF